MAERANRIEPGITVAECERKHTSTRWVIGILSSAIIILFAATCAAAGVAYGARASVSELKAEHDVRAEAQAEAFAELRRHVVRMEEKIDDIRDRLP